MIIKAIMLNWDVITGLESEKDAAEKIVFMSTQILLLLKT